MLTHSSKQSSQVAQARPTSYITILGIVFTLGLCSVGLKAFCGPYVEVHYTTQFTVQQLKSENYQQALLNSALEAAANDATLTERELPNVIGVLKHAENHQMLNSSLPYGYSGEDYQINYGGRVVQSANNTEGQPRGHYREGHQAHEKTIFPSNIEGAADPATKLKDNDLTHRQEVVKVARSQNDRPNMTRPAAPIAQFAVQYRRRGTIHETGKVAGPSFEIRPCKL